MSKLKEFAPSTLKGKNLLPEGKVFIFRVDSLSEGQQSNYQKGSKAIIRREAKQLSEGKQSSYDRVLVPLKIR